MKTRTKILTVLAFLALCSISLADELLVPSQYPTIQAAIDAAFDGDTVLVADGTYTGKGNHEIDFCRKDITVRSESGPENCIIDCNGIGKHLHRAFVIRSDAMIAGFTIINGHAEEGGAIYCEYSSPTIINCILSNNSAEREGGAIYCEYSSPTIINCNINDNYSEEAGGGIFCERTSISTQNTVINNNFSAGDGWPSGGGGIACWRESDVTLQNCTISENTAEGSSESRAGGIWCTENSSLTINNSEIKNNIARSEHKTIGGGILCSNHSRFTLYDSTVTGNTCQGNDSAGGGIYYEAGVKCTITDCTIEGNIAKATERSDRSYGGGIFLRDARPFISKCIIRNNSANTGAGITLESSDSLIWGTIISGNFPLDRNKYSGGGIYCMNSNTSVGNCTIVGNSFCGLYRQDGGTNVTNSILYYNDRDNQKQIAGSGDINVIYSDVQRSEPENPPWPGEGNINADPCFIESGYWDVNGTPKQWEDDFWVEGNYRLLTTSPCIDTGCSTSYLLDSTDLDGDPRVIGQIDMGAYEFKNTAPVANAGLDQTVYAWVNGMAKVTLDGSASSDADGHPLTYLWTWTIDSNTYDANGAGPVIELPVGEHSIELIVNDGIDNSEPDEVVITVVEPIESRLLIYPRLIHRNNHRKKIMAYLSLPQGITKYQVDNSKSLLLYPGQIEAMRQHIIEYNRGGNLYTAIFTFFNKDELMDAVPDNGQVELQVVGQLKSGQYFYGSDTIRIIARRLPRRPLYR